MMKEKTHRSNRDIFPSLFLIGEVTDKGQSGAFVNGDQKSEEIDLANKQIMRYSFSTLTASIANLPKKTARRVKKQLKS